MKQGRHPEWLSMCWTDVQTCVILFSSCQSVSCLTRCDGKMSVVTDFLLGLQWHINGLNQILFPKVMWISRGAFSRCFSAIVIDFFVFIPCWNQGTLRVLSLCRTVVMDHIDKMGTWDAEWKLRFFNLLLGPEWSYQYVGSPTFCKIISQKALGEHSIWRCWSVFAWGAACWANRSGLWENSLLPGSGKKKKKKRKKEE